MFMRKAKKVEEDSAGGVPAWMMTFSDCMTLLLTFFVLLLSFSSFDEASLKPLEGAFECQGKPSIFGHRQTQDDSVAPEVEPVMDKTDKGSEKPTDSETELTKKPKEPRPIVDMDAYRDERTFYIPVDRLFVGKGGILTRKGKEHLEAIASFMKLVPCKVIIGQIQPNRQPALETDGDRGLKRSWVLLQFLTERKGLSPDRFRMSPMGVSAPHRFNGKAVMRITLLNRDVTQ